jgi:hypothetical protein
MNLNGGYSNTKLDLIFGQLEGMNQDGTTATR